MRSNKGSHLTMKRNVLGKGLSALLPDVPPSPPTPSVDRAPHGLELPIETLQPNPSQPRTQFDAAALDELAASIRHSGLVQPILVRHATDGRYQIIAGERRWR